VVAGGGLDFLALALIEVLVVEMLP
jgi:hypothetical protein